MGRQCEATRGAARFPPTPSHLQFTAPEGGLLAYMRSILIAGVVPQPIPAVSDKEAWFKYFDDDDNGALSEEELVRAIIKTLGSQGSAMNSLKFDILAGAINALFPLFGERDAGGGWGGGGGK